MSAYTHKLHLGMTRAQVRSYLDAQKVPYRPVGGWSDAWADTVEIAKELGSLICDRWTVYIALNFQPSTSERPEVDPLPGDTLKAIQIRKSDTACNCSEFPELAYSICTSSLVLDSGEVAGAGCCGARQASNIET